MGIKLVEFDLLVIQILFDFLTPKVCVDDHREDRGLLHDHDHRFDDDLVDPGFLLLTRNSHHERLLPRD